MKWYFTLVLIYISLMTNVEKAMATHCLENPMDRGAWYALAWRIPGTGELGGLLSMGSHRLGHN